jgi:hypothetical protein
VVGRRGAAAAAAAAVSHFSSMHTRATPDDISFQLARMISSLSLVLSLSSFRFLLSLEIYVYIYIYLCIYTFTVHKNESRNPMTGSQAGQGRNPRNLFWAICRSSIVSCCLFTYSSRKIISSTGYAPYLPDLDQSYCFCSE